MFPSSSFFCLYCMVLRVLLFHLLDQIGACCVRCAWRKLRWDYYLCTGCVLYVLKTLLYRIVQHKLYCMSYISVDIFSWGYCFFCFCVSCWKIVLVGRNAIFRPVLRNKLVILCTGGPWKVKVVHLLLCFWGGSVWVTFVLFVISFFFSSWMMCSEKPLFLAIVRFCAILDWLHGM